MTELFRPRRSLLYMPALNARALEKAKTLPVDGVIFDLEDSVAPEAKAQARAQMLDAIHEGGYGKREVIVRVNGPGTDWIDEDLEAVAKALPDVVLVPKINTAQDIEALFSALDNMGAPAPLRVWAMIETPMAILKAPEIGAVVQSPANRLEAWVMGTNDLAQEIGCALEPFEPPLVVALSRAVLAARAYGLVILDGVYNDIADLDGFAVACQAARNMGFDGKTLIHPKQIEPCNAVFSPSKSELDEARAIIAAFELAENQNKGVIMLEGRMVERLHLRQAVKIVDFDGAAGLT